MILVTSTAILRWSRSSESPISLDHQLERFEEVGARI
jgi:hypothetical protein